MTKTHANALYAEPRYVKKHGKSAKGDQSKHEELEYAQRVLHAQPDLERSAVQDESERDACDPREPRCPRSRGFGRVDGVERVCSSASKWPDNRCGD